MSSPAGARRDEFAPDVAAAVAAMRAAPAGGDQLRSELKDLLPGVSRRGFLQLTGAAAVFALAACGKKPDTLVPYARQPEGATLGEARWYASVVRTGGHPAAVLVKTYDGRPIKIEGNPDCPLARGASDLRTQAALLDLYDPDRAEGDPAAPDRFRDGPRRREGGEWQACAWDDLDAAVGKALAAGGGIALLHRPVDGPAGRQLIADLAAAFPGRFRHAAVEPFAEESLVAARAAAFGPGPGAAPVVRPDRAALIVTLGGDLLGGGSAGIAEQVRFGDFRRRRGGGADADTGELICLEPVLTQTGTCADLRVRVAPDRLELAAWAVAARVAAGLGKTLPPAAARAVAALGADADAALGLRPVRRAAGAVPATAYIAERLLAVRAAKQASLVWSGGASQAGPECRGIHLAAAWLNWALGNEGVTVCPHERPAAPAGGESAAALLAACAAGEVKTLIVWGCNPAYHLPQAAAAIAAVPLVVSLNDRRDETARLAHWHAPGLHDLESWGDAELSAGVFAVQQPAVRPLWDARAAEESLLAFAVAALGAGAPAGFRQERQPVPPQPPLSVVSRRQLWQPAVRGVQSWQACVRRAWLGTVRAASGSLADDAAFWSAALVTGVIATPEPVLALAPAAAFADAAVAEIAAPGAPGLRLVLSASRTLGDGAQANNAWLIETPDPVSKITWDSWLSVSPADARAQGWAEGDVVDLRAGDQVARLPVHVQEGQHPGVVEAFLGWGREPGCAGAVADLVREGGFSVNAFRLGARWGQPVAVAATGARHALACTQGHQTMAGRDLAMGDVLELHRADPGLAKRRPQHPHWAAGSDGKEGGRLSLWGGRHQFPGHRWGLAIDLTACTGCHACMVACTAENNIPVVGRDEVVKNRGLNWIRIDRYFLAEAADAGDRLDVEVVHQPVMCLQCENAPCEAACPANATMKNDEGINLQIYNRCIGTRYCSNNCPYKVRRFNWYEYSKYRAGPHASAEPLGRMVQNAAAEGTPSATAELSHKPLHLLLNPEVTVRTRGVMEKCNLCLQRQRGIREREKASGRAFRDGEATTACAQACPTRAIVFGDLNDAGSEASRRAAQSPDAYQLLDRELNTRPAVAYLARLRKRPPTPAEAAEGHA